MSTKCSIAYGDDFHLYHESLDHEHVYLELFGNDVEFEVGPRSVMVRIPIAVWEHVRHRGGPNLSVAGMDDAAIEARVREEVDRRLADCKGDTKGIMGMFGLFRLGSADEPYEDQVAHGVEWYRAERVRQARIRSEVARLDAQPGPPFVIPIGRGPEDGE